MKKILTILLAAAAVTACSKETVSEFQTEPMTGVCATAQDFSFNTKTSITEDLKFSWKKGDVIGVVPMDNHTYQTNYEIKTIGQDPKAASFDGGAWALKDEKQYAAYFPCQSVVLTSEGNAELTFEGQKQSANNNLSHIGNYDYMYAGAKEATDGNVTFDFKHKVSILKITVPVQESATYTKLTISSSNAVFAQKAQLSIADGTMTGQTLKNSLTLNLDDISLTKGDKFVAWMVVMPTTVNSKLTISLYKADTPFVFETHDIVNTFVEGTAYQYTATEKTIYSDDFSWMSAFLTYVKDGKTCADFVNGNYTTLTDRIAYSNDYSSKPYEAPNDSFSNKLKNLNYTDENSTKAAIYGQGNNSNPYLKFCRGNVQTALGMKPFTQKYGKVCIKLDWAIHMTSSNLDESDLQLRIEGAGYFSNGQKVSEPFELKQKAQEDPQWSHAEAEITSVDSLTKILISTKQAFIGKDGVSYTATGQHRFYLDNIVITTGN